MKWAYTNYEGGHWWPLNVGDLTQEEVIDSLFENQCVVESFYEGAREWDSGLRSRVNGQDVHSVRFPDGRVWDSAFGCFRDEVVIDGAA